MRGRLFPDVDDWYRWAPVPEGVELRVRLEVDETGRHRVRQLEMSGEVSAKALRSVPVGRIEAAANALFASHDDLQPPVATLPARPSIPAVESGWEEGDRVAADRPAVIDLTAEELVLGAPEPAGKRSDDFYRRVAGLYRQLAVVSSRPAADIAEANDVPTTTVHRWIKEARRRDLLPPGRAGTAG